MKIDRSEPFFKFFIVEEEDFDWKSMIDKKKLRQVEASNLEGLVSRG